MTTDPDLVHTEAGREAERAGDLASALVHFQAALAQDPHSLRSLLDLARVLLSLERFDEAQPLLVHALQVSPGQPRALRGLARIARARGEPDRAVELIEAAITASPQEASLRFDHADALRAIGRFDAAEAAYRAAGALSPGDQRVAHGLAIVARARNPSKSSAGAG